LEDREETIMAEVTASPSFTGNGANELLQVRNLGKLYGGRGSVTTALDGLSFSVDRGEFVGIMGPSGSGKTTLLNCIATIDTPTTGHILLNGSDISDLKGRKLSDFRRDQLGFVFQDANLLDTLTGFENIALALTIKGERASKVEPKVEKVARKLGVEEVLGKFPNQMSGGQRQRVAAARAIVSDPQLVLADEPTGALDSRSANVMLETLEMMNRDLGVTIMMVTHDAFAASFASRVLFIKDGSLFNEIRRGDSDRDSFFGRIMDVMAFLGGEAEHAC
jgi:putative ABC transport system ATP-binding protein